MFYLASDSARCLWILLAKDVKKLSCPLSTNLKIVGYAVAAYLTKQRIDVCLLEWYARIRVFIAPPPTWHEARTAWYFHRNNANTTTHLVKLGGWVVTIDSIGSIGFAF